MSSASLGRVGRATLIRSTRTLQSVASMLVTDTRVKSASQQDGKVSTEDFKVFSSHEDTEALASPLLRSEVDEFGEQLSNNLRMEPSSTMGSDRDSLMLSSGPMSNPGVRRVVLWLLQIRTAADALPSALQSITNGGKMSVFFFLGGYTVFIALWFPIWLLSFITSEIGIYALVVALVFLIGRSIIRLIAFPGASNRVSSEIEKEFNKYSVRMLLSASNSLIDLASAISAASKGSGDDTTVSSNIAFYEIPTLWKRAKSYRDRVLAVYADVLHYLLKDRHEPPINSSSGLTKYGNNRLSGDIGDLSGLTPEARQDGRILLDHLKKVLADFDRLELQGKPILEACSGKPQQLANEIKIMANSLIIVTSELRDFVESLKPPSTGEQGSDGEEDESLTVDAVRRRFEEQNGSLMDSVKAGMASILPMLDPPLHTSIFGFDLQRGCMLSRYRGARQFWVQRPGGGMIDVLHIPAKSNGPPALRNPKAVMYCNPNAGLIEVATGMSLAGGNVASDADGVVNDNCWADFYTNLGFDVFLFNYAGFGRSYGAGYCGIGRRGGDEPYVDGTFGRIQRILHGTFCSFQPTPATLRADGLAVGSHLVTQLGVESLIIHGESIGGVAASGTARELTSSALKDKVALLICDRTFCNLEAVAQRLVGGWSGYAIRALAPFWSTDVAGDFIAASCPKVVATDCADAIIADPSSLRSGVAFWKEIYRGISGTKGIGWKMEAPLQYRMADWENVSVNDSRIVPPGFARTTSPVWPADKHVSLEEAFHFAACVKRIGKVASIEKKRISLETGMVNEEGGIDDVAGQSPIFHVWKYLGCCEGLCGAALGMAVRGGFDNTVYWLCSTLTYGGQTVVEGMEQRKNWSAAVASKSLSQIGQVEAIDFDCRPPGYEQQESDTVVHPKPIPEVLTEIKKILEENPMDEILASVGHELAFAIGTLDYIVARLSSPGSIQMSWKNRHLHQDQPMMVGSFMNLHCGHNNPFSAAEKDRLKTLLLQATGAL